MRLLGLEPVHPPSDDPGLIILQIDGLSRSRLEEAIQRGRIPFIASLVHRDRHRIETQYSGQPATTPAVLGELFYGVEQIVPAFSFRDHRSGKVVEMLATEIAEPIEKELAAQSPGLLGGGAAYCDIYSGGADDAQFCPGRTRWKRLDEAGVWTKGLLVFLHLPAMVRMFAAIIRETVLSTWRLVRRRSRVRNWVAELKFIPRHLVASVVLREVTATAIESDAIRGVERVHGNFLGYDDVAHHCGPDADIPHRMLRDIDRSIQRIWHAAHASPRRNYQVWIIADHGQEATIPYSVFAGRSINEAVCEACRDLLPAECVPPLEADESEAKGTGDAASMAPLTVAIGPQGSIYWPGPMANSLREDVARRLVVDARIPMVMYRDGETVHLRTSAGLFQLPEQAAEVFGVDHPHLDSVARDFSRLCSHPDAGDLIIAGWRRGETSISFVDELGAHGGPGPNETSGFAILPPETACTIRGELRPKVLRDMALEWLERPKRGAAAPSSDRTFLRVATYNVHGCIGLDGRLSPARIARVLLSLDADVIALQELDVGRLRSRSVDQAQIIADLLEMKMHFGAAIDVTGERYGNAILSRWPMTLKRAALLSPGRGRSEPRGAVWATVTIGDEPIEVISTHLGLTEADRLQQLATLLGADWPCLGVAHARTILCGDLNSPPGSSICRGLGQTLRDVQLADRQRGLATWPSGFPLRRIDHIFAGDGFRVIETDVPRTRLTRVASDHLPLVVDLEILPACGRRTEPVLARTQTMHS
ncbi:Endonuclease/Exonuclease/phosphatase family protein [Caulifigura coniformis]|uniref:Endonuclease/Exonuclease/phosphatase family protein n=1 Tax=Caulifigura coniformis TaxID=2527983 RepID=A0A517SBR2_9PLAN|nr:Endonuclease/Exonuclease/phosphatase family protein [Caulifigura coniformis]